MPVMSLRTHSAGSDGNAGMLARERVRSTTRRVQDLSSAGRRPSPDRGGDVPGGLGGCAPTTRTAVRWLAVTRRGVDERITGADDKVGPKIHGLDDPVHEAAGLRHRDSLEPHVLRIGPLLHRRHQRRCRMVISGG